MYRKLFLLVITSLTTLLFAESLLAMQEDSWPQNDQSDTVLNLVGENAGREDGQKQAELLEEELSAYSQPAQPQPDDPWWQNHIQRPILETPNNSFVYIPLEELVVAALNNSRKIHIAKIDGFVEQEKVVQQEAEFDWAAFAESLFINTNQQTGSGLEAGVGIARLNQQDVTNNVGIRRKNEIGGTFEAKQDLRLLRSNSLFTDPEDPAFSQLTLRYNQPLLRDGGLLVNHGQIVLAQLDADATVADSQAEITQILVQVVEAYWNVYRLRCRYVVQKELVDEIKRLLDDLSRRTKIDARPSLIGEAESEIATQLAELAATKTQLIQAQLQLVRIIGDRNLGQFGELIPITHSPPMQLDVSPQTAIGLALQNRPELRAVAKRIERSQLVNQISIRQLLPSLALIMETSVNGVNADFKLGRSLGDQYSEGGPSYSIGLNYELPFGNRGARSRHRQSELELARELATLEDTVDQVRLEVENALAGLTGANNQFSIRQESIEKADQVVRSLLKRREIFPDEFDQVSQLYVRQILDAQQRKATAEVAIIDLFFEFATTTIKLREATGTLLNNQGFGTDCGFVNDTYCQNDLQQGNHVPTAPHAIPEQTQVLQQANHFPAGNDLRVASKVPAMNQPTQQPHQPVINHQSRYPLQAIQQTVSEQAPRQDQLIPVRSFEKSGSAQASSNRVARKPTPENQPSGRYPLEDQVQKHRE